MCIGDVDLVVLNILNAISLMLILLYKVSFFLQKYKKIRNIWP